MQTLNTIINAAIIIIITFIFSYIKKKGANWATKEDFQQLLEQVKKQTEETEKIKQSIFLNTWSQQKIKELKIEKLEEFLLNLTDQINAVNLDKERIESTIKNDMKEAINFLEDIKNLNENYFIKNKKDSILIKIYFPEYSNYFDKISEEIHQYKNIIKEMKNEKIYRTRQQDHEFLSDRDAWHQKAPKKIYRDKSIKSMEIVLKHIDNINKEYKNIDFDKILKQILES